MDDLNELADCLTEDYPQYTRAARYLHMLGGQVARPTGTPPVLQYILAGAFPPVQRGSPSLPHPKPHSVRQLGVSFQRFH